jgi:hypothetical protein
MNWRHEEDGSAAVSMVTSLPVVEIWNMTQRYCVHIAESQQHNSLGLHRQTHITHARCVRRRALQSALSMCLPGMQ